MTAATSAASSLTEQQSAAVFLRELSVFLSSGAGCGKTHVLTERYLAHLREGSEVGQIVAITFTERAARQMRDRIRRTVLQHLRQESDPGEAERWARHLRNLETAPISTIHSFCGTLLRQYAVEAGLDPAFDVLEEVLSLNLETEAEEIALQKLLTSQNEAGEDLRELVLAFGWGPVTDAVQNLLREADPPAWRDWLEQDPEAIIASWLQQARTVLLPQFLQFVLRSRPKIACLLPLLRRYPPLPGPMAESVARLLEELPGLPHAENPATVVERLHEAGRVGHHGKKAWPDPSVYATIRDALRDFRKELEKLNLEAFNAEADSLRSVVLAGQRFVRVAREALQVYRERKRLHGVVDFQDLLFLARDLLRSNETVRARLQERYRHLLIDELQDTDPVQMELVRDLCGGELGTGKLFAVGDPSQSIYRFRGADVHLFRQLRREVAHEGRLELTVNFRSQPAILDFVNQLVTDQLTDYEPLRPHLQQLNPAECVEFLWTLCGEKEDAGQKRSTEALGIAQRIAQMIGREHLVADRSGPEPKLRPVRRGDVVLLFRSMSNVHRYEAALRQAGLDYYLVGGRAFFAQQEIYDLLHLLRALENPQDELSLAGLLRSPFCCVSDETLFLLCRRPRAASRRRGLWAALHDDALVDLLSAEQAETVRRARRFLDRWRSLKDRLPIARLLGEVLADSGYDAALRFEFLGDRKLANLWKLIDLARTFDRSGLFGLADFVARLGDLVASQPREEQAATQPEQADVIRLMTIHQAKGLEFPVVFLPDLDATPGAIRSTVALWDRQLGCVVRNPAEEPETPLPDFLWQLWTTREKVEEWNESSRILYVACTRAQDYLVLSSALAPDEQPSGRWMLALDAHFDLVTGVCRAPGDRPIPRIRVTRDPAVPEQWPPAATEERTPPMPAPLHRPEIRKAPRLFTISEVLAHLRGEPGTGQEFPLFGPSGVSVAHEDERFFPQFDAEDGSDRNRWPERRAEVSESTASSPEARLLQAILQDWDWSDPQGWRAILRRSARQLRAELQASNLEQALSRFVQSSLYIEIEQAAERHSLLEFCWPIPPAERSLVPEMLGIRGWIDCLWQDVRGGWHLLKLTWNEAPERRRSRSPELAIWAQAIKWQLGVWPRDAVVQVLHPDTTHRLTGQSLRRWSLTKWLAGRNDTRSE